MRPSTPQAVWSCCFVTTIARLTASLGGGPGRAPSDARAEHGCVLIVTVHFELGALSRLQVPQKLQHRVQQHLTGADQELTATGHGGHICNRRMTQSVTISVTSEARNVCVQWSICCCFSPSRPNENTENWGGISTWC